MKKYRYGFGSVVFFAVMLAGGLRLSAGPVNTDFNHQPWSGLEPNQAGAETVGDSAGVTVTRVTVEEVKAGDTATKTTVTRTRRLNRDGSEQDTVVTVVERSTTGVSSRGHEYVKDKTRETLRTEREVGADKAYEKKTVRSVGRQVFPEPDEHGNSPETGGSVHYEPTVTKMTDVRGDEIIRYKDEDGVSHERILHRDGSESTMTGKGGGYTGTRKLKDGTLTVTEYSGKKPDGSRRVKKEEVYDPGGRLTQRTEYDKTGRWTRTEYPRDRRDSGRKIERIETDYFEDSSVVVRRIYAQGGAYVQINYLGGHPISKDFFDEEGARYDHEVIPMERWGDPEYSASGFGEDLFADRVGFASRPGAVMGRDIGVSAEGGFSRTPKPGDRHRD